LIKYGCDIDEIINTALKEDINNSSDITSDLVIGDNIMAAATMHARENGIIAGAEIAAHVFKILSENIDVILHIKDGSFVSKGDNILTATGSAKAIMTAERTALNLITHMSGIATQTAKYVSAVKDTKAKILDTRKTIPGLRGLQKYAVRVGGGTNHRHGLYDMILIKDNHIAIAGGIKQTLNKANKNKAENIKVEIEVDNLEQLEEVIGHGGADIVMLDNMSPAILTKAVDMVNGIMKTEASGGINLDTILSVAQSGVDAISVGALTHSVTSMDIGLDIEFNID